MTSAFSQRLCRKVRQEGYGANRRFRWVPGADYSTQVEVLLRREHAHRVWNIIQAVAMVAVVDELRFMCDRRESGAPWDEAAAVLKGPKP